MKKTISANPRMTGESYTAVGTDSTIGPPHFGLSSERIQVLDRQERVRIAAENAEKEARQTEKEARQVEKAARKAAAKEKKLAARGKLRDEGENGKNGTDGGLKTFVEVYSP